MKFKIISTIVVIIVVLISIFVGTMIKNNNSEDSQSEQIQ
jgi:hypothetical protein